MRFVHTSWRLRGGLLALHNSRVDFMSHHSLNGRFGWPETLSKRVELSRLDRWPFILLQIAGEKKKKGKSRDRRRKKVKRRYPTPRPKRRWSRGHDNNSGDPRLDRLFPSCGFSPQPVLVDGYFLVDLCSGNHERTRMTKNQHLVYNMYCKGVGLASIGIKLKPGIDRWILYYCMTLNDMTCQDEHL